MATNADIWQTDGWMGSEHDTYLTLSFLHILEFSTKETELPTISLKPASQPFTVVFVYLEKMPSSNPLPAHEANLFKKALVIADWRRQLLQWSGQLDGQALWFVLCRDASSKSNAKKVFSTSKRSWRSFPNMEVRLVDQRSGRNKTFDLIGLWFYFLCCRDLVDERSSFELLPEEGWSLWVRTTRAPQRRKESRVLARLRSLAAIGP